MKNERWPNTVRKEVRYIRIRDGKEHTYKTVRSLVRSMAMDAYECTRSRALAYTHNHDEVKRRLYTWLDRRIAYGVRYQRRVTKLLKDRGIE